MLRFVLLAALVMAPPPLVNYNQVMPLVLADACPHVEDEPFEMALMTAVVAAEEVPVVIVEEGDVEQRRTPPLLIAEVVVMSLMTVFGLYLLI